MVDKSGPKIRGGAREGAGRPAVLKDAVRRNITFEPKHLKKLARYAKRHELSGYAEAIRSLIDEYA